MSALGCTCAGLHCPLCSTDSPAPDESPARALVRDCARAYRAAFNADLHAGAMGLDRVPFTAAYEAAWTALRAALKVYCGGAEPGWGQRIAEGMYAPKARRAAKSARAALGAQS